MTGATPRTLVLGFDALDFDYLDRFRDSLPNFEQMRADGVEAPLESTLPPWTGSAWPSMYTGTHPGVHDVHGFFSYSGYPETASVVSRSDADVPAIWNYLTANDVPSIVCNVPVTHPAEPIEGVLVPGYLAPENEPGYPDGIRDELAEHLGEPYRIYSAGERDADADKLSGYVDLIGLRGRAASYLLEEYPWKVAVIQVQKTDAVFHNYDDPAAFRRVYEAADDLLGSLRDQVGDANVVVCSDHGIGPTTGYKIFLNEVLREAGYLEATTASARPTLSSRMPSLVDGDSSGPSEATTAERLTTRAVSALDAVGLTPGDAYVAARRAGLESLVRRVLPASVTAAASRTVDWRNSKVYCRNGSELGVRVNLAGREADGVVPESEYEQIRSEIVAYFSNLRTPDGEPAFELVSRYEEVYGCPPSENACDVVVLPTDMNHVVLSSLVGRSFVPTDGHNHKRSGVFLGAGPAFDETVAVDAMSLTDVAPTVLASVDQPVPERMTGTIPDGLLTTRPRRSAYGDVPFGTVEQDEVEDSEVEDRLKDLGYM